MSQEPSASVRELITIDVTDYTPQHRAAVLKAIRNVERSTARPRPDNRDPDWNMEAFETALMKLAASKADAQIRVIKRAIKNGGSIARADVYEISGYQQDRSLKGFTRPANRVTQELRDSGEIPEDADELLEPIYDLAIKGYQRAHGFRVPQELVSLINEQAGRPTL